MAFEVGEAVTIMECHKVPQLVGKKAKVVTRSEGSRYPVIVLVLEPVVPPVVNPLTGQEVKHFGFRDDELAPTEGA